MAQTIETERLILRAITDEDIADVYEYAKNPNVGNNAGWSYHKSVEESKEIANQMFIGQDLVWGIALKEDNKIIGTIGFVDNIARPYENGKGIGYALSEKHWGQGYMTEAVKEIIRYGFEVVGFEIIHINCYAFNLRSKKVIEKSGFIYEGTLRKATTTIDGKVVDLHYFSILKEEYDKGCN